MASELLLEIGTEEIPARFIPPALEELAGSFGKLMEQERIAVGEILTWGTPRRLALIVKDMAASQAEVTEEIIGPPKAVALDAAGQPTAAAKGFAKAQGVAVSDLMEVDTPRGIYLALTKRTSGRSTLERLPEVLPAFILGLSFPKSMRWGSGSITFARPIHWILARCGGAVVPFDVGGVASGGVTFGHRFLSPQAITVQDAASYVAALQKAQVMVDPGARRALLEKELAQAAARVGGEVVPNPGLLTENIFLVEYPSVICGHFEEKFLAVPDVVLITAMREHQRYFSLRDQEGRLLPHFIAVNNTLARDPDLVRQGHERVLRARLSDAKFFFEEDQKVPLERRVEALKGVVFHSLLGTSYEKMERFRELAGKLLGQLEGETPEQQVFCKRVLSDDHVRRAATLCKADLVTEVVGEFPSLQGEMGRVYARLAGEPGEVAEALFTHYLPRHAGDALPPDLCGTVVGLADRLDTICGCFGVGLIPTGTADPYGLRRHALAIINILLGQRLHLDLPEAVWTSLNLLPDRLNRPAETVALEVLDFFQTRLQHLLLGEGFDFETVTAVLAGGWRDVVGAADKVRALEEIRQSPEFPALAVAFKRVINIAQGAEAAEVDELLFEYPEEKMLFEAAGFMELEVAPAMAARDYAAVCRALARLKGPVDAFFEQVLVMAEDLRVRRNRLALLLRISQTFLQMADFSRITTSS
jgi:glycyl-tRNA synthetase beta chain